MIMRPYYSNGFESQCGRIAECVREGNNGYYNVPPINEQVSDYVLRMIKSMYVASDTFFSF